LCLLLFSGCLENVTGSPIPRTNFAGRRPSQNRLPSRCSRDAALAAPSIRRQSTDAVANLEVVISDWLWKRSIGQPTRHILGTSLLFTRCSFMFRVMRRHLSRNQGPNAEDAVPKFWAAGRIWVRRRRIRRIAAPTFCNRETIAAHFILADTRLMPAQAHPMPG